MRRRSPAARRARRRSCAPDRERLRRACRATPRAILSLVRDEPRAASDIARAFPDITQQAVSLHLRALSDAGLVDVRPAGRRRLYVLRPEGLQPVRDYLDELWPGRLDLLKQAVEREVRRGDG